MKELQATTEEKEGAKDREDNAEHDVEGVEPGVDGEEATSSPDFLKIFDFEFL